MSNTGAFIIFHVTLSAIIYAGQTDIAKEKLKGTFGAELVCSTIVVALQQCG
jgi:hypothetical protein